MSTGEDSQWGFPYIPIGAYVIFTYVSFGEHSTDLVRLESGITSDRSSSSRIARIHVGHIHRQ